MSNNYINTTIAYDGKIIRVINNHTADGRIHEVASRPPGTRIIVHDLNKNQILLNREVRLDIGEDLRLPGGKVRDTNAEWDQIKDSPQLDNFIVEAAAKEMREEAGLTVTDLRIFTVSTSGGPTIKWDMYYLVATNFSEIGHQSLTEDEVISNTWVPIKEVVESCLTGKIREGRTVAAILQYLHSITDVLHSVV